MLNKTNGSNPDLSLVIPCFNERDNVVLVVRRLAELIPKLGHSLEVIFVDGGSNDGTPDAIRATVADFNLNDVEVVVMSEPRGYGYDILHGLKQTKGNVLAWTHADMQTDVNDVFVAYAKLLYTPNERVFVKGVRKNRALMDVVFTFGMQVFVLLALQKNLSDINAQPKLFGRDFFDAHLQKDAPEDFSFDLFAYFKAQTNGYLIVKVPVVFAPREHGEAKGGGGSWANKKKLIRRTIVQILKLRRSL